MLRNAVLFAVAFGLSSAALRAEDKTPEKQIEYHVYGSYFESNQSGLKGDATSIIACLDQDAFDNVFHPAAVMRKKQEFLPKDAFDKQFVVAVIKRGKATWDFKVESVTAEKDTVFVRYKGEEQKSSGTATFATPLIIALDKGSYTSVVYIENGKEIGKAKLEK